MTEEAPSLYLLYGDDSFAMEAFISTLSEKLGDASTVAMNRQRFEGDKLELNELQTICSQMPFLAERRLVIVDRAQNLPKRSAFVEGMQAMLTIAPGQHCPALHRTAPAPAPVARFLAADLAAEMGGRTSR